MKGTEHSEVRFGRTAIPYRIVRGRRQKTVAIAIDPQDGVLLRAPAATPVERLDAIVHKKAIWILERLRKLRDLPPPPSPRQFVSGETFLYLGRQHRLRVERVADSSGKIRLRSGWLVAEAPVAVPDAERPALVRKLLVAWYRQRAAERLPERASWWSERLSLQPAGVLIRSQEKRWASCDPAGVLRFNWRIVQASPRLLDYVVVHELIHLVHPDHTTAYWAALGQALPDYEDRRDALRKIGARLVW
jgi:predicted metal-dependent hydrolase